MSNTFYSPNGNPEIWAEKPEGYLTVEEYEEQQRPIIEQQQLEAEQARLNNLFADIENVKKLLVNQINSEVESNILMGFDYNYNSETLHFSYDRDDQQNFADTANACLMAKLGDTSVPQSVIWNSYTSDGSLKQIELTPDEFQMLYNLGALAHKKSIIYNGSEKKARISNANTREELENLISEFNLSV